MPENYDDIPLVDNNAEKRFELKIGSDIAFIDYKKTQKHIILLHTEVPKSQQGKGIGTAIIKKALHFIEQERTKLYPVCPFVQEYIQKHPEWNRIVDQENQKK